MRLDSQNKWSKLSQLGGNWANFLFLQRRVRSEGVDVHVRGGELAMHEGRAGGRRGGHEHERGAMQARMQGRGRQQCSGEKSIS